MTGASSDITRPAPSPEYSATDAAGLFEFKVTKAKYGHSSTVVAATASKLCIGWVQIPKGGKTDDLTIHLLKEDVPIEGRILSLEGKPVPSATITVMQINAAPDEDIGPWLDAIKNRKGLSYDLEQKYLPRMTSAVSPKATTDAGGQFKLMGIGANRLVTVRLEGPTIATQNLQILTRAGERLSAMQWDGDPENGESSHFTMYYGAKFEHPAAPTRPIVGIVRDMDTKKPLAGATIQSVNISGSLRGGEDFIYTTSDAEGRYRLIGMPRGDGNIVVLPKSDQPYLFSTSKVADTPGLDAVTVDFDLKRVIWIEGKIIDKATGKPVNAFVEYHAYDNNPNLKDHSGFAAGLHPAEGVGTLDDGSYRIAGLPGPGLIVVSASPNYLRATERDDEFGMTERRLPTLPYPLELLIDYSAIAAVKPADGIEVVKRDVTIDPGWTFTCKLSDKDGKPVSGARGFCLGGEFPEWSERLDSADIVIRCYNPRQRRDVLFLHHETGLAGVVQPPRENGGQVTIQMQSGATVTGRLIDELGKPRPGLEMRLWFKSRQYATGLYSPGSIHTDKDGRFRIEALVPGFDFRLLEIRKGTIRGYIRFGNELRYGEVNDLGDVRIKPD